MASNYHLIVHLVLFGDLLLRIALAELNRWSLRKAHHGGREYQRKTELGRSPKVVASVVGFRESPETFDRCLRSYLKAGCDWLVVGIDGDQIEDEVMVRTFRKVCEDHAITAKVLRFNSPIGESSVQDASDGNHPQWTSTGNRQSLFSAAFAASSEQIKSTLGQSQALKFTSQSSLPNLICFTQPHRNLKEIRLASWMISSVLAELYDLEYIWSSDSDTLVRPSTLTSAAGILSSDGRVGGLSALVQLNNGDASFVSGMAQAAFGCDSYLNRAALGSIGRSECLNGPGSMFRATALREVAFQWYCFEYPNSMGTVAINEDIQVTMLLAQRGWKRLYSDLSIIETGGPTTLRGWIGQRVRWSRGLNLHRWYDVKYIISQGPLYALYFCRTIVYDVAAILLVIYHAGTGRVLFRISTIDLIMLELIPPIYNILHSTPDQISFGKTALSYACYRLSSPIYRLYALFTPLESSWGISQRQSAWTQGLSSLLYNEREMIFTLLCISALGVSFLRILWGLGTAERIE